VTLSGCDPVLAFRMARRRSAAPLRMLAPAIVIALVVGVNGDAAAQQPGPNFRPTVMMVGCLADDGTGAVRLDRATAPVVIEERLPEEPTATTPLGDRRIQLIGTLEEFGVGAHIGHKVRVRGLYITGDAGELEGGRADDGHDRLNLTSLLMLSPSCAM